MNAKDLKELSSADLKNTHGVKSGSHRTKILKIADETVQTLDFKPRLRNGVFKETLTPGDGKNFPKPGQLVHVFYEGLLLGTNKVFDACQREPFICQIGRRQVISGWDLGIPQMSLGERARLYIRSDHGYGPSGCRNSIPPNADLLFFVELLKIEEPPALPQPKMFPQTTAEPPENLEAEIKDAGAVPVGETPEKVEEIQEKKVKEPLAQEAEVL